MNKKRPVMSDKEINKLEAAILKELNIKPRTNQSIYPTEERLRDQEALREMRQYGTIN